MFQFYLRSKLFNNEDKYKYVHMCIGHTYAFESNFTLSFFIHVKYIKELGYILQITSMMLCRTVTLERSSKRFVATAVRLSRTRLTNSNSQPRLVKNSQLRTNPRSSETTATNPR